MKKIIILFVACLCVTSILSAAPTRKNGLSVHIAPERAPEIFKVNKRGFIVSESKDLKPAIERPIFDTPQQLIEYFENRSQKIRDNGIWVITTNPRAYTEAELKSSETLINLCEKKKILISFCRGTKLPNGWIKGNRYNLKNSDEIYAKRQKALKLATEAISNARKRNLDKALELYTECLKITFEPAFMYHGRGKVYGQQGKFLKSIADMTKAIELNEGPKTFVAQCYNDRAIAYLQSGSAERSWQDAKKAKSMGFPVHPGFLSALKSQGFPKE